MNVNVKYIYIYIYIILIKSIFTDIFDISIKSNYRYIRVYRYFDSCVKLTLYSQVSILRVLTIVRQVYNFMLKKSIFIHTT